VLLTHLSAVDLIVCIAVLLSILPETFNQYEKVAPWLCPVHGFLFNFLHPMAIWTVCGLNCDRSVSGTEGVVKDYFLGLGKGLIYFACIFYYLFTYRQRFFLTGRVNLT
jgi:hypothetical protein